ncbi:MAG: xanthine dehydrogenase family protein molybdopterin-binding subunit [Gemmobacter sp.]
MNFGRAQGGRDEDARFLTGTGRYVDDIAPPGALHAVFLRAPHAHAEIARLDVRAAGSMPGVRLILTADLLEQAGVALGMRGARLTNRDGSRAAGPERPVLARGRVRFVGEPVACIVAETLAQARDAAEAIAVDYDERPAKLDLAPGGEQLHAEAPDNIAFDWETGDAAATDAAMAAAAHRISLRVADNRIAVASMEPRGCFAEWDGARLHLCVNGQGVWNQKAQLCAQLGLSPGAVRVTNPDVGGGFGMKAMAYPEYVVVGQAARMLSLPVRWMSDRTEAMLTDNAGRDLVSEVELGFDAGLRLVAYRVSSLANLGAYNSQFGQPIQAEMFAKVLTGVYDIPAAHLRVRGIYTNTTQVDAYRGAGRPEAILALERGMDHAARVLGADPFDLRRRSMIRRFPYRTATAESYDCGDFPALLDRVHAEADVAGFPGRCAESRAAGRLRGMGLAVYIEAILGDPSEAAEIAFHPDGWVTLAVGTQSNGQGHETVFARFLAARSGIAPGSIRVVQGDSDRISTGGGTGGSRSATVQTNATIAALDMAVSGFARFLAPDYGTVPTFGDGVFSAAGSNLRLTLQEAAERARAAGRIDLLQVRAEARLRGRSYPNGAHLAEVEIDPETGALSLARYTTVDDFGTLLAPQLVAGQVHGGIAQGAGQILREQVVHDATGQLLTASFMDYAIPRADDLPMFRTAAAPVPSAMNPLGMKGCGEAGTVGALAACANAVADALFRAGALLPDPPYTPLRLWSSLREVRHAPPA